MDGAGHLRLTERFGFARCAPYNPTVRLITLKQALRATYAGLQRKHMSQLAAGLSYYFVLSIFPFLIAVAAGVALLPIPSLFEQILGLMGRFVPADSMGLVRGVLKDVLSSHGGRFLSAGIALTVWAASGGFAALIDALNVAYGVEDKRGFLHRRVLAVGLALGVGTLMVMAFALMVVGSMPGGAAAAENKRMCRLLLAIRIRADDDPSRGAPEIMALHRMAAPNEKLRSPLSSGTPCLHISRKVYPDKNAHFGGYTGALRRVMLMT